MNEGRTNGRTEGRKEGREEEREGGRKEGRQEGRDEGRKVEEKERRKAGGKEGDGNLRTTKKIPRPLQHTIRHAHLCFTRMGVVKKIGGVGFSNTVDNRSND